MKSFWKIHVTYELFLCLESVAALFLLCGDYDRRSLILTFSFDLTTCTRVADVSPYHIFFFSPPVLESV